MANVKFYLKRKDAKEESLVLITIHYHGKRFRISSGFSINPRFWNDKKGRAKVLLDFPLANDFNDRLDNIERKIEDLLRDYRKSDNYPSIAEFKNDIFKTNKKPLVVSRKFWDLFDAFVLEKSAINVDVRNYNNSLRKQLKAGEKVFGAPLSFGALKLSADGFVQVWDYYLTFDAPNSDGDFGLSPNTIGKLHKDLKSFLNWCFDHGYTDRFSLKHLPTIMMDVENVYLTEEELEALVELKVKGTEKRIRICLLLAVRQACVLAILQYFQTLNS
jgi:hypothetical protein